MTNPKKATHGVMIDILPKGTNISSFEKFIKIDEVNTIDTSHFNNYKEEYNNLVNEHKSVFKKLALLEQVIIQNRCFNTIDESVKLIIARGYIYARALFYRQDNEVDDIRVIVGKTDEYGDNPDVLLKDKGFMEITYNKLYDAMEKEIEKTEEQLNQINVNVHI